VVFAVAWVVPCLGLEGVDDALWRQFRCADPAGGIGKACAGSQHDSADGRQAQGLGGAVQR